METLASNQRANWSAPTIQCTLVQNKNSCLIICFPSCSGVSEWVVRGNKCAQQSRRAKWAVRCKQMGVWCKRTRKWTIAFVPILSCSAPLWSVTIPRGKVAYGTYDSDHQPMKTRIDESWSNQKRGFSLMTWVGEAQSTEIRCGPRWLFMPEEVQL